MLIISKREKRKKIYQNRTLPYNLFYPSGSRENWNNPLYYSHLLNVNFHFISSPFLPFDVAHALCYQFSSFSPVYSIKREEGTLKEKRQRQTIGFENDLEKEHMSYPEKNLLLSLCLPIRLIPSIYFFKLFSDI